MPTFVVKGELTIMCKAKNKREAGEIVLRAVNVDTGHIPDMWKIWIRESKFEVGKRMR